MGAKRFGFGLPKLAHKEMERRGIGVTVCLGCCMPNWKARLGRGPMGKRWIKEGRGSWGSVYWATYIGPQCAYEGAGKEKRGRRMGVGGPVQVSHRIDPFQV